MLLGQWRQIHSWMLPVFAVVLAIILFIFQASIDLVSLSIRLIAINAIFAILISIAATIILVLLYLLIVVAVPKFLKRVMVWITFKTVTKAVTNQTGTIQASGITSVDDNIGVELPLGSRHGVTRGDRFVVLATAMQEKWGVLQVDEVYDNYSVCSVSDSINEEFWGHLESRMRYYPSPPRGVTIRREIPEEALLEWLRILLRAERLNHGNRR